MSSVSIDDILLEKPSSATWALCRKQWHELLTPFAVMSLVSLVLMTTFGFLSFDEGDYYGVIASLPVTISICFIFVCCFISFVSERENRTSSFLMNLPLSSVHVGAVKVLMIVVTVTTFCAGQVLMAGIGTWIKLRTELIPEAQFEELVNSASESGPVISLLAVFAFVISLVSCSFWSRSWASVLTAAVLSCYSIFTLSILDEYFFEYGISLLYVWEARCFVAPLAVLVIGAIWFPLRWLRKQPSGIARRTSAAVDGMSSGFAEEGVVTTSADESRWRVFGLPRGGRFGALLWQSCAQQKLTFIFSSFFLIVFLCSGLGSMVNPHANFLEGVLPSLLPALGLTALGAGWLTLHHDKKDNNFEFFQQQREHGIALMIARVIPPVTILLVLTFGVLLYMSDRNVELLLRYTVVSSWITGYCASLLCSMVFRSQVYALGAALVVASVTGFTIMGALATEARTAAGIEMGSPHVPYVDMTWMIVLPFIWLISSILYGPRWLSQRRSWPWTIYLSVILLAAFSLPIFALGCWLLGIDLGP